MAISVSTGAVTAMLDRPGLVAALEDDVDGYELRFYGGTVPGHANASTGTAVRLLTVRADSGSDSLSMYMDGPVLVKDAGQEWYGDVDVSGRPTFFRLVQASDDNSSNQGAVRIQGSVGVAGADINLMDADLVQGVPQHIKELILSLTEAFGG